MNKAPIMPGSIVISKAGRDEGRSFVVISEIDADYVRIADGKTHKVEKPKKKKRRHLTQAAQPKAEIVSRLTDGQPVFDHEVRRWLSHEEG